tara:strand:- start:4775 stop:5140 length:366 start_codon:yes stop_codon:yes gene_type:complete
MTDDVDGLDVSCNDFIIQISPIFTEDSDWSGDIELNVAFDSDNELEPEDFETLYSFTTFICSLVPALSGSLQKNHGKGYLDKAKKKMYNKHPTIDNVVKVDFNNKANIVHMDFNDNTDKED